MRTEHDSGAHFDARSGDRGSSGARERRKLIVGRFLLLRTLLSLAHAPKDAASREPVEPNLLGSRQSDRGTRLKTKVSRGVLTTELPRGPGKSESCHYY